MGNFAKLIVLMWKNWILVIRKPKKAAWELLTPVFACFFLLFLRHVVTILRQKETKFDSFGLTEAEVNLCSISIYSNTEHLPIAYAPKKDSITEAIKNICPKIKVVSYNTSRELKKAIDHGVEFYAAILFEDELRSINSSKDFPLRMSVTLRLRSENMSEVVSWYTNFIHEMNQLAPPRAPSDNYGGVPDYAKRGFLFLQKAIIYAFLKNVSNTTLPDVVMKRLPEAEWYYDAFYTSYLEVAVTTLLLTSVMYTFMQSINEITSEKENQLKEAMIIMGLSNWLICLGWFLRIAIVLLINVLLIMAMLNLNIANCSIFPYSSTLVLFVFLLLFVCSIISFIFALSACFSTASTAVPLGVILYYITYLPALLIELKMLYLHPHLKLLLSILSNSAFAHGISLFFCFESEGIGIHWNNINQRCSLQDNLSMATVMVMLVIDSILYLLIAIYVENIFPGKYGVPQPWYFPVTRAYWRTDVTRLANNPNTVALVNKRGALYPVCPVDPKLASPTLKIPIKSIKDSIDLKSDYSESFIEDADHFEKFDEAPRTGILLTNVSKKYGKNPEAVNNLTLRTYKGQITVLLGHTGAGKSTTISMITGMLPPSSGTIIVNGYDMKHNKRRRKCKIGFCLQHDVFFEELTVQEHLYFFSKIKGMTNKESRKEIAEYTAFLGLDKRKKKFTTRLSRSSKRKLSVAIALCGKSEIVLLDEPTTEIDTSSKRAVWNLLWSKKEERTILVATNLMKEADMLADRMAIIKAGHLLCCGSIPFLKKHFGAGYYIIMKILPTCKSDNVTDFLKTHLPDINIHLQRETELIYYVSEDDTKVLQPLLSNLDTKSKNLGIESFTVSLVTLEDIFMKIVPSHKKNKSKMLVNQEDEESDEGKFSFSTKTIKDYQVSSVDEEIAAISPVQTKYLKGCRLKMNQFKAMFLKRVTAATRLWLLHLIQILFPVILFVISAPDYATKVDETQPLAITLDIYEDPVVLISGDKNNTYYKVFKEATETKYKVSHVDDISKTILDLSKKDRFDVKLRYIVAASFEKNKITAWFNANPFHSAPLALGVVLNAIYKSHLGKSIQFINQPLPITFDTDIKSAEEPESLSGTDFAVIFELAYGLIVFASFYVLFCIEERISKFKHMQMISGIDICIFWTSSFIFDLIIYLITASILVLEVIFYDINCFKTRENFVRLIVLLVCYGFSVIPFMYLASYYFSEPANGIASIVTIAQYLVMVGIYGLSSIEEKYLFTLNNSYLYVIRIMHWMLLTTPFYSFARGLQDITFMSVVKQACAKYETQKKACHARQICCHINDFYHMNPPGIGGNITMSSIMFVLEFTILIAYDHGKLRFKFKKKQETKAPLQPDIKDNDVEEEMNSIENTSLTTLKQNYPIVVKNLTKYYKGKEKPVLNGIYLRAKPFECLGLLSSSEESGACTVIKLIVGEEKISFGEALVNGFNVSKDAKEVRKFIGYCPGYDAFFEDFTVKETLKIFALIHGVPCTKCKKLEQELANELHFEDCLNKKICELNKGNKRRLSVALALIGDPMVLLLDAPTKTMDSIMRSLFWTNICKLRQSGKCIILTSKDAQECESICTKIGIVVNGNLRCLGSPQHLQEKFGQGYALMVKLKMAPSDAILDKYIVEMNRFVNTHFGKAKLKEQYHRLLTYHLLDVTLSWSKLFGLLESNKELLHIEEYSLGQCSLRHLFVSFTRNQHK